MTQHRIATAVTRIEQALARIETQAALAGSGAGRADPHLAARHEALRTTVAQSLSELDTLIEGMER